MERLRHIEPRECLAFERSDAEEVCIIHKGDSDSVFFHKMTPKGARSIAAWFTELAEKLDEVKRERDSRKE